MFDLGNKHSKDQEVIDAGHTIYGSTNSERIRYIKGNLVSVVA